jgi:hypothetical protein
MRRGSGSARSVVAVVADAFLRLCVHRIDPTAPLLKIWPLARSGYYGRG